MKKNISFILIFSIFLLTLVNCSSPVFAATYVNSQVNVKNADGVFDYDKSVYDLVYGSGKYYVDDDGYLWVQDGGSNALNSFTSLLCLKSNIVSSAAKESGVSPLVSVGGTFAKGIFNFANWLHGNKDFVKLRDGALEIGKDAISSWRDVFRNNCYELGSYKLITNNISNDETLSLASAISENAGTFLMSKLSSIECYFVSSQDSSDFVLNIVLPKSSSDIRFLVWPDFSTDKSVYLGSCYRDSEGHFWVSSLGYNGYFIDKSNKSLYNLRSREYPVYPNKFNYRYHGLPLMIFASDASYEAYFDALNSDSVLNVYYYNNYSPTNINIDLNTYNNTDYTKINNTIYNSINQQKNEYITNNQTITENDLQLIIEKTINQYIDTQPDTPGGGGGSGGGGDSSGGSSSGKDYTTLLEDIKQFLNVISSKIEGQTSVHLNTQQIIKDIKTLLTDYTKSVTDSFTSLLNKLDDMKKVLDDLLDGQGDSLLDKIIDFLSRTASSLLTDFLKDLIDTFIGEEGIVDAITTPAKALASQAQSRFPTSIPWDVIAIINVMSAEPECPKIEIPFKVERLGINYMIKIDLEKADTIAELSRNMLTVTFLLFLVIQTRKLYGAMSKN